MKKFSLKLGYRVLNLTAKRFSKKIGRTGMDLAKINTAVMLTLSKENKCENVAIVIGSCAPTILRAKNAEEYLREISAKEHPSYFQDSLKKNNSFNYIINFIAHIGTLVFQKNRKDICGRSMRGSWNIVLK
jgi:hypothetical protein